MKLNKYLITLASDRDIIRIIATARNKTVAIALVMKAENCPSYAILKVQNYKE